MNAIIHYFPELSEQQREQFQVLMKLYPEWNAKINVISRKDIDNLEINHILHSLGLVKFVKFTPGTTVLDLGTGGGFPAIPLAVYYPQVNFHLVDRIGKKLRVAQDVAQQAGLTNVTVQHGDVKEVKGKFHFVVSRAVMPLGEMVPLVKKLVDTGNQQNAIPNGLLCLKGGDLQAELMPFKKQVLVDELSSYFSEEFFKTKKIVYLPL
ncbi:MAG: 16S rRNA (guanine(527)-N(7))-methyltransferase RsmG [Muribaculaceae bacterium]|nr:16S rRNA (guanine(527)-N(7))-methyltransferase RsmG [Muribaculaceae bacterium]MBQ4138179.1 16S rRNA (guanine(527)-N(7))-methyltransferase RsmG [Muribaculaceae bacterium]